KPGDTAAVRDALAAYRQSVIHEMTLPASGLVFRLKRVGLVDLVMRGDIPDTLSGIVDQSIKGKEIEIGGDDLKLLADMYGLVMTACVVWPPIAAGDGDDEHLGLDEISFEDKQAIFDWANGEASALKPFREEPGRTDVAVHDGESIRETAE
ncbi:MAG: hypothetical protein GY803_31755, partial [Chloroflexi bacterium]|nr:hypothetical protein [Chloroflexota bacterium]